MIEHYKKRLEELRASYDEAKRKRDEIAEAVKAPAKLTPAVAFDLWQKLDSLTADIASIGRQIETVAAGLDEAIEAERKALKARLGELKK